MNDLYKVVANINVSDSLMMKNRTAQTENQTSVTETEVTFIVFMITLTVAGFIGNSLIIATILLISELRTTRNMFLINLAVSDFMVIAVVVPYNIISVLYGEHYWHERESLCVFVASVCAPGCLTAIWSITAVALNRLQPCDEDTGQFVQTYNYMLSVKEHWEQTMVFVKAAAYKLCKELSELTPLIGYVFICHNAAHARMFTLIRTTGWILTIWLLSFLIHLPNHIGWGHNGYVEKFYLCTRETALWSYSTFFSVIGIILPLCLCFYSYLKIYALVRTTTSARNNIVGADRNAPAKIPSKQSSSNDHEQEMDDQQKRQSLANKTAESFRQEILLIKTLFRSFMVFLVAWLPMAVLLMLPTLYLPSGIYLATVALAHGSTATNSILYYTTNEGFRNGLRSLVLRFFRRCERVSPADAR